MVSGRIGTASIALVLATHPSFGAGAPRGLPHDLSQVGGIEDFPQDPALRALLSKNGFAVVPRFHRQIFSPYLDHGPRPGAPLPPLITVESAMRTYQVILEKGLIWLETAQAPRLQAVSRRLLNDLTGLELREPNWMRARDRTLAWAAVGLRLQAPEETADVPPAIARLAEGELAKIEAGELAPSAIFEGTKILYGSLRPAGFYADDPDLGRFFQAVKWYGVTSFLMRSEEEAAPALLLALACRKDPGLLAAVERFSAPYQEALGPRDDPGVAEAVRALAAIIPEGNEPIGDEALSRVLPAFQKAISELPAPTSNDQVLSVSEFQRFDAVTRGIRLLGPRASWAGALFNHTALKGLVPQALQAMRAIGDEHAEALLRRESPDAEIKIAREEGTKLWKDAAPSIYRRSVAVLDELFKPAPPEAPPFARTEAWRSMCTWSALGSWTCIRHAWQLHEKQEVIVFGMLPKRSGYVVPYPGLFERLGAVARDTDDFFGRHGAYFDEAAARKSPEDSGEAGALPPAGPGEVHKAFLGFAKLLGELAVISRKQIAGRDLDARERKVLEDYGDTIGKLQFYSDPQAPDDDMPLVAPLYTDVTGRRPECAYTAIGRAVEVYAIREAPPEEIHMFRQEAIKIPGGLQLYRGGTFSCYEFSRPAGEAPLDDHSWKKLIDRGEAPPFPGWSSDFLLPIRATPLERLAAGEPVAVSEDLPDPEVKEAALKGYFRSKEKADSWAGSMQLKTFLDRLKPEEAVQLIDLAAKIEEPEDVASIAGWFSKSAPPEAKALLFDRAASGHRHLIVMAFQSLDPKLAIEESKKVLGDSELGRWSLAQLLGSRLCDDDERPKEESVTLEALRSLSRDESFRVRAIAMGALEGMTSRSAIDMLRAGLVDPSPAVRVMAARSLTGEDLRELPLVIRTLWYIDDPAIRPRLKEEEAAFSAWVRYGWIMNQTGVTPDLYPDHALVHALRDALTCHDWYQKGGEAWHLSFQALEFAEKPTSADLSYDLARGVPELWASIVIHAVRDTRRPIEERRAILESCASFEDNPRAARALTPLLDDPTVLGPSGERISDLIGPVILRMLRPAPPAKSQETR